jgi:hypothetical protein
LLASCTARTKRSLGATSQVNDLDRAKLGELLGWVMTAIYFSSRLPQIWTNYQRGSVEGLSAVMFLLAITGNVTYLGAILVKSCAWQDIKNIMPWIVDAFGCQPSA